MNERVLAGPVNRDSAGGADVRSDGDHAGTLEDRQRSSDDHGAGLWAACRAVLPFRLLRGRFLAASTGIVGATVVTMGLLSLPTMLRNNYSPEIGHRVYCGFGHAWPDHPAVDRYRASGTLAGDLYSAAQETRAQVAGCSDALTFWASRRWFRSARFSGRDFAGDPAGVALSAFTPLAMRF